MRPNTNNYGYDGDKHTMAGVTLSVWSSQALTQSRRRRTMRQAPKRMKAGVAKMEWQPRKMGPRSRQQRAVTAIVAATMLAFMPFRKPLGSFDRRSSQSKLVGYMYPAPMAFRSCSLVESRLPYAREDPCSFRTRLEDEPGSQMAFDSSYMLESDDIKFDDTQCISVGRSMGKFQAVLQGPAPAPALQGRDHDQDNEDRVPMRLGAHLYATPADILGPENDEQAEPAGTLSVHDGSVIFTPVEEHQDTEMVHKTLSEPTPARPALLQEEGDDESDMETMNMPFWHLPKHKKRHSHHGGDNIPDDMSIISDVSLIPTYFPSDIMKQQRPHHRALIKRLIVAKARSARQTMRQLKRTVGNVFVDTATHQPTKCVRVGAAY